MAILPNNGVSISAVRSALLESMSKNDLGSLCKSTSVRQWSKYKPVRSNKILMSQPQDWYSVNDGFYVYTYYDAFDLLDDFLRGIEHCWEYQKPTGESTSPYRLGDFRGYNHDAVMWFNLEFENASRQIYAGETRHVLNNSNNPAFDIQEILNNFPAFSAVSPSQHPQTSAALGFLMVAANSIPAAGSFRGCEFYRICNVADYDDDKKLSFTMPSGLNSGTYYFVPVIISFSSHADKSVHHLKRDDSNYGFDGATWYPLPTNVFSVTLNSQPYTPQLDFFTDINLLEVAFNYNSNDEISDLEGDIQFSFSKPQSNPNDNVRVTNIQIQYRNTPISPITMGTSSDGTPQSPNYLTTQVLHFNHKDSFDALMDNWKQPNKMPLYVTFTVSKSGSVSQTISASISATVTEINGNPV